MSAVPGGGVGTWRVMILKSSPIDSIARAFCWEGMDDMAWSTVKVGSAGILLEGDRYVGQRWGSLCWLRSVLVGACVVPAASIADSLKPGYLIRFLALPRKTKLYNASLRFKIAAAGMSFTGSNCDILWYFQNTLRLLPRYFRYLQGLGPRVCTK